MAGEHYRSQNDDQENDRHFLDCYFCDLMDEIHAASVILFVQDTGRDGKDQTGILPIFGLGRHHLLSFLKQKKFKRSNNAGARRRSRGKFEISR